MKTSSETVRASSIATSPLRRKVMFGPPSGGGGGQIRPRVVLPVELSHSTSHRQGHYDHGVSETMNVPAGGGGREVSELSAAEVVAMVVTVVVQFGTAAFAESVMRALGVFPTDINPPRGRPSPGPNYP